MKKTTTLLVFLISAISMMAQSKLQNYDSYIRKADSLYRASDFKSSSFAFSEAFKIPEAKITMNQRYNPACSYALANNPDSAFFNLNHIASFLNYTNFEHTNIFKVKL